MLAVSNALGTILPPWEKGRDNSKDETMNDQQGRKT